MKERIKSNEPLPRQKVSHKHYCEGWTAARYGGSNPYPKGSFEWASWVAGFEDAGQRRAVRVYFENGSTITTDINGTEEDIRRYYLGQTFNLGDGAGGDRMSRATRVEFLDVQEVAA